MKPKNEPDEIEEDDDTVNEDVEDRQRDYSELKYVQKQLSKLYDKVVKSFEDKSEQSADIDECWDMYNCTLNENQVYVGEAEIYVPIVRDAMAARETRFVNMLFPQNSRYSDVVGEDGKPPFDLMALLDYYVRQARLREVVVPAMIRTGDAAGHYALYMDWAETTRCVTSKKKVAEVKTEMGTAVEGSPEYDDVSYEEVTDQRPDVMVLDPRNLSVLPTNIDSIEDAEAVTVMLRWTEDKIRERVKQGVIEKKAGDILISNMTTAHKKFPDTGKKAAAAAGVTLDSKGNKVAAVFQTWSRLKIRGERRMMVTHFGGEDLVLGCKRNPYWCDRIPVILQAVEKNPDSIWGPIPAKKVAPIQYQANDVANMGFDSAQYALLPIVMTDPEKNPRAGSMVLAMASVWLTNPKDTQFANFPPLWKDALTLVGACKQQIYESLGVNPAMIPHANAGKKPSQAQIAQEQQVALESSADNVALIQEGVLSKVLEWFYEMDYQYRDKAITVKKFGQLGLQADMDQVEPWQVRQRYQFNWYGTEGFKAQQQVQGMISWANVLRGIPPQMLNGRKIDLGPMAEYVTGVICGPKLAPHTLIDQRHQLSMDAGMENQLIRNGFPVQVHEMDDDMQHIQIHAADLMEYINSGQDVNHLAKGHILEHLKQAKAKAAAAGEMSPGQPGTPGGAGPGVPGQPRPGATAQSPTNPQQPAGAARPDQMATAMPRKAAM